MTILLFIICGLCWSGFDVARKFVSETLSTPSALGLFCCLQIPIYIIWIQIEGATYLPNMGYFIPGIVALILNFSANYIFFISIKISDISKSIPMLSLTPIFSLLFSWIFVGEVPNVYQILGCMLVSFGAIILNGTPSLKGEKKGPYLMALVALLWGCLGPFDKLCIQQAAIPTHILYQVVGIIILLIIIKPKEIFTLLKLKKIFPKHFSHLALGTFSAAGALSTQLYLMNIYYVGLVEAVKRTSLLIFSLIIGNLVFKEKITTQKLIALSIMIFGLMVFFKENIF